MPPPIAELCLFPAKIYSNACNTTLSEPLPGCLHPSLSPPWCLTVYNAPKIQTPHQSLRIRVGHPSPGLNGWTLQGPRLAPSESRNTSLTPSLAKRYKKHSAMKLFALLPKKTDPFSLSFTPVAGKFHCRMGWRGHSDGRDRKCCCGRAAAVNRRPVRQRVA